MFYVLLTRIEQNNKDDYRYYYGDIDYRANYYCEYSASSRSPRDVYDNKGKEAINQCSPEELRYQTTQGWYEKIEVPMIVDIK